MAKGLTVDYYAYDVYDQRIGKVKPTGTERFVYGQNQNIALEFDGSGALTNRYLHGNSIDEVLADEANGSVGWALTDNLGSVRDVVDATGTSQNHVVFDSFGNVTSFSEGDRFDDYLSRAIAFLVLSQPAIASMIDFWGSNRDQGIFAERSLFFVCLSDRLCNTS